MIWLLVLSKCVLKGLNNHMPSTPNTFCWSNSCLIRKCCWAWELFGFVHEPLVQKQITLLRCGWSPSKSAFFPPYLWVCQDDCRVWSLAGLLAMPFPLRESSPSWIMLNTDCDKTLRLPNKHHAPENIKDQTPCWHLTVCERVCLCGFPY